MLEMLLSLFVMMALITLTLTNTNNMNLEHYSFLNEYLLTQTEATLDKEDKDIGHGIYFNSMGHVNQAKTIEFDKHDVIVHLGNGYATIK